MAATISFLSDFGRDDEFVGVVHGVIGRIAPEVNVLDITHGLPRGNARAGALALLRAIQYLPGGVALAVGGPGVGTGRRAIAARTPWGYFVGPDNGLLAPAVAMVGGASDIVSLGDPRFRLPAAGATLHGRDLFAPAAAVLASGEATLEDLGPAVPGGAVTPLLLPLVETNGNLVSGEVWWIDGFGNAQTNVSPDDLAAVGARPGGQVRLVIGGVGHELLWATAYGDVDEGEGLVHVDSYGHIAIAVRGGRADEDFPIAEGVAVQLGASTRRPGPPVTATE